MSINSSEINSSALNATSQLNMISITLNDSLNLFSNLNPRNTIEENLSLSSSVKNAFGLMLLSDNLLFNSQLSSKVLFKNYISQTLQFVNTANLLLEESVTSNLAFQSNLVWYNLLLQTINNNLSFFSTSTSSAILKSTVIDLIHIVSNFISGGAVNINESLVLTNTLTILSKLLEHINTSLSFSSSVSRYIFISVDINDSLTINSSESNRGVFHELLNNNLTFYLKSSTDNPTFITYSYSPESNTISEYSNYSFISSSKFGNNYLFINKNGLYKYGGNKDNSQNIKVDLVTAAIDFGTSNLKMLPYLYLGTNSSGAVILKVRIDGKADITYKLNKFTDDLETLKIDMGKGLLGRYYQFELITEADEFDMESMEFTPIIVKRKI